MVILAIENYSQTIGAEERGQAAPAGWSPEPPRVDFAAALRRRAGTFMDATMPAHPLPFAAMTATTATASSRAATQKSKTAKIA
jgi:hypothetical protein